MRNWILVLALVTLPAAECIADDLQDEIDAFRTALADPHQFPVRQGMKLEVDSLKSAMDQFTATHAKPLRERFESGVAKLKDASTPAAPEFRQVLAMEDQMVAVAASSARFAYLFHPDLEVICRMALSSSLPVAMSRVLGMATSDIGSWLGFLSAAKPVLHGCGKAGQDLTVCVDYGGVDIFVLRFSDDGTMWAPSAITWWQRLPAEESGKAN